MHQVQCFFHHNPTGFTAAKSCPQPFNITFLSCVVRAHDCFLFSMAQNLTAREAERLRAVQLRDKGFSEYVIAVRLKRDVRWVQRTFRRLRETGSVKDRPRSGRRKKMSAADIKRLKRQVKGKERKSIRKAAASFKTSKGLRVCKETIRYCLHSSGLIVHRKRKSTLLNVQQREKRIQFAQKYRRYDWSNCAFWDETEIELIGPPNKKNDVIWDDKGAEYLAPEPAHPIVYKFGIAVTARGVTSPVPYTQTIDKVQFQQMVGKVIPEINQMFEGENWTWVCDKATPHSAKESQKYLADNVPSLFPREDWPANSPDENPAEQYFSYLEAIAREKKPQTLVALKRIVNKAISETTPEMCKKFISPLPTRLKRIIALKGGYVYNLSSK